MVKIEEVGEADREAKKFYNREWVKYNKARHFKYEKHVFIAKDGEKIIGHMDIILYPKISYLKHIIVKDKYRKKGVGKELLKKFEDFSRKKGYKKLLVMTSTKHRGALTLYLNSSYKISKRLGKLFDNAQWYYMIKTIK